ncbi:hypothetical protein LguiB_024308 [Lonicera macranthoides]
MWDVAAKFSISKCINKKKNISYFILFSIANYFLFFHSKPAAIIWVFGYTIFLSLFLEKSFFLDVKDFEKSISFVLLISNHTKLTRCKPKPKLQHQPILIHTPLPIT